MVPAGEETRRCEEEDIGATLDQSKREERLQQCVVRRQGSVEYGQGGGESNVHGPL